MSTCNNCGRTPCGCQDKNVYHPSTPDPYAHHHAMHQPVYQQGNCGIGVIPTLPPSDSCNYGPAQPIDKGVFQALDSCGKIVPYARVTVTYVATGQLVPLYYRPIASPQYAQENPVTTNEKGRASIFFFSQGHDVRIVVQCVDGTGQVVDTIDSFVQYAANYVDNYDLANLDDVQCLTINNPRILIYDADNCNKPHAFMDLRYAMIEANIRSGIPAGSYTDVKNYYNCLGCEEWADGVIVYGECGECGELYQYKGTCDQECPPNPCDADYDADGESICWRKCDKTVCEQVTDQPETKATHALDCDNGLLVRRQLPPAPQAIVLLDQPVLIQREDVESQTGNYDSGVVTIDLNTLPGVTVPINAKGVIVKALTATDGDETTAGATTAAESGNVAVEGTLPVSRFDKFGLNVLTYADSNLGKNDNDNHNDAIVAAPTLPNLRYQMQYDFAGNPDSRAYLQLALVGFVC